MLFFNILLKFVVRLSILMLFSLFPITLIVLAVVTVIYVNKDTSYQKSTYYQTTKHSLYSVQHNKGLYGEYLTYKHLQYFETNGAKFLFNLYIPKENNKTTEIDILMICPKGLFVFESKNYSGWIFGSENQKNWYQILPTHRGQSHKEHFYNPIMQNRSHIKHLKAFLGEQIPMRSIIVFSDRCTLKNIEIKSSDVSVINRYNVFTVVSSICNQISINLLSENDITNIYNKLYPYTQVDANAKAKHIISIHNNLNPQPLQQTISTNVPVIQSKSIQMTVTEESKTENVIHAQAETVETKSDVANPAPTQTEPIK